MRRLLAVVTIIIMSIGSFCACVEKSDEKPYEGTWHFCGVIEEENETSIENAVIEDEFLNKYGLSEMPDNAIKIDNNGITGSVPGSERGAIEPISDVSFSQKEKISIVDGVELDDPITAIWTVKVDKDYLIVSVEYDDPEYDASNASVYKKSN